MLSSLSCYLKRATDTQDVLCPPGFFWSSLTTAVASRQLTARQTNGSGQWFERWGERKKPSREKLRKVRKSVECGTCRKADWKPRCYQWIFPAAGGEQEVGVSWGCMKSHEWLFGLWTSAWRQACSQHRRIPAFEAGGWGERFGLT